MRKFLSFLSILVLLTSFSSCKKEPAVSTSNNETEKTQSVNNSSKEVTTSKSDTLEVGNSGDAVTQKDSASISSSSQSDASSLLSSSKISSSVSKKTSTFTFSKESTSSTSSKPTSSIATSSKTSSKQIDYASYQREYNQLTSEYETNIETLQNKIKECNDDISKAQRTLNNAKGELLSLSPSCPQYYIQQYVNNWQAYGSTAAATQAAKDAWKQTYNSKKTQLNNTITTTQARIQSLQSDISSYNLAISGYQIAYNDDVCALKQKYGI